MQTVKTYLLAALGAISAIFAALFYREKGKRQEALKEGIEEARKAEHEAYDEMSEGLKKEAENVENIDNSKRTDFE